MAVGICKQAWSNRREVSSKCAYIHIYIIIDPFASSIIYDLTDNMSYLASYIL